MRHAVRSTISVLALLFAIPALASITGTVMNPDGGPIAGAKISAFTPETVGERRANAVAANPQRKALATATTGADGSFRLDVPKDTIAADVHIEANGYAPDSVWALADDEAGAIVLTPAAMKSGTVTAGGKPVPNAHVFWAAGTAVHSATTDEKGRYSAPDPSKWAQRVVVVHPDYAILTDNALMRDRSHLSLDRTLSPGVKLTGRVVAEDGSPVAGAELFLDHFPAGKSGDDGTFAIPHAKSDWSEIEARSNGRIAMRARANGAVTLKLAKAATLAGSVIDLKTQQPVPGAEVALMPPGVFGGETIESAITDAKGSYTIANLPAGNYTLNPQRTGYALSRSEVGLLAGRTLQKALYGTPHARVSGTIVDEDKRPVAAAHVTSRAATRDPMNMVMMFGGRGGREGAYSGPDGRFVVRDVTADADVTMDALKRGFPAARTASMKLAPGEKKTGVTITIPRGIALSGRVLDKNGKPIPGASIEANESRGDAGGAAIRRMVIGAMGRGGDDTVRTASDGTFTVRVKEGHYDVAARAEGYAAKVLRGQNIAAGIKPVEITLEPGVEITGRVARGGMGVDGVNIAAMSTEGVQTTVTGPDGSFRLGDLTPGPMMLAVNRQDAFIQEIRNVTAPANNVIIDVPSGGRITGHVVDKATHQPIPSFQAGVSTSRGGGGMVVMTPPMLKQFTSDDGSFTLENIRPGPTQVVANAPGYTAGRVSNVEVEDGKTTNDVTVEMETGVRLTGKVTSANGSPLAGVSVAPDMGGGRGRVFRMDAMNNGAVTDPNGDYTIESQEPGEKTFVYSLNGYVTESRSVTLSGKEVRQDVQLSSGLHVAGVVVTEGGAPVADATVRASSPSDSTFGREARTDANGAFALEGLAPGHYSFIATKSGYANGVTQDVDVTTVNPVRVTMKSGGTITGHVGGLSTDELSRTTVTASAAGAGGSASAAPDSGGNFRIDGAPTGTVRVAARTGVMFGGNSKSSEAKTVVLDPGGSATADLEFKSNTVIRGHITRNGQPLGNAMVNFFPRAGRTQTSSSTTSDGNGYYEISSLDDGTYSVQVTDFQRLSPYGTTYEVKGSGTFDIDIRMASVRGRVLDSTNDQPLADARVELRAKSSDMPFATHTLMTDSGGNFISDSVARGSYTVSADKEGYGHAVRDLTVEDTAPDVELKLSPSAGVTLRVIDGRDGRLLSASARVVDMQGNTVDDPSFRFGGAPEPLKLTLSPGTYRVTLLVQGYATTTITVTSPSTLNVPMTPGGTVTIRSKSSTPLRGRLMDANGMAYSRAGFGGGFFPVSPSPGVTTLSNVAPGSYRLELVDGTDRVVASSSVTVNEGQESTVDL